MKIHSRKGQVNEAKKIMQTTSESKKTKFEGKKLCHLIEQKDQLLFRNNHSMILYLYYYVKNHH